MRARLPFRPLIPVALLTLIAAPGAPLSTLAGFTPAAHAQIATKRLILKDGSFQIVTKWQIKGDRVHYFSAEREDWEDIPNNLIDWDATNKWNKEHAPGAAPPNTDVTQNRPATGMNPMGNQPANPQLAQPTPDQDQRDAAAIDKAVAAERADQRARTPLVAPGLHLPDENGIFALDDFQGIPELIFLEQHAGNVNEYSGHNVLRAAIASFRGAQEPIRIDGQAARVRLHVNDPALYVSLTTGNSEEVAPESALVVNTRDNGRPDKSDVSSPDSHYAIVRVDVRPGERVVGALRISRAGTATQSSDIVPTAVQILPGRHWMKLTPKVPLDVGEYALMEILAPGEVNLDVWDFGVSPNSPENAHPITPIDKQ
ncbi:MAG TPA: hypothetical protein VHX13_01700 [Acidobacteriaceae bacterium]|jgi:hypothetical protein|nr:hypothetical protein [Acidobacteriaceae bacterium]